MKISIFFDTNALESWQSSTLLSLSKITIPKTPYYDVINYIETYKLWSSVEILIPDMVVMEMKHHMMKEYTKNRKEMQKDVHKYKELFGELINFDFSDNVNEKEYLEYIEDLFNDFFTNPRNHSNVIECKKDSYTMEKLIGKAVRTEAPFSIAGDKGKKYSDAGFKDAVIYETIVEYIERNNTMGILFTGDKDYGAKSKDFKIISVKEDKTKSVQDFKKIINSRFNITEQDDFEVKLKNDVYLKSKILEEAGLHYDDYDLIKLIPGTYKSNNENIIADIVVQINEDLLRLHVEYNYIANEIFADNLGQFEDDDSIQEE